MKPPRSRGLFYLITIPPVDTWENFRRQDLSLYYFVDECFAQFQPDLTANFCRRMFPQRTQLCNICCCITLSTNVYEAQAAGPGKIFFVKILTNNFGRIT